MQVIGHGAVGVEEEGVICSGLLEELQDVCCKDWGAEMPFPVITADGDEIGTGAEVVSGWQAGIAAVMRHTIGLYCI